MWQTFENEYFHITVLTTPLCKAVVDNAAESTCACFKKFAGQYSIWECKSRTDSAWNIKFAHCNNGPYSIGIKKKSQEYMDQEYFSHHYSDLMKLITDIFNKTDDLFIKKWMLRHELSRTQDGHTLFINRWVPAHLWQIHFPDYYTP